MIVSEKRCVFATGDEQRCKNKRLMGQLGCRIHRSSGWIAVDASTLNKIEAEMRLEELLTCTSKDVFQPDDPVDPRIPLKWTGLRKAVDESMTTKIDPVVANLQAHIDKLKRQTEEVYKERNLLIALLAQGLAEVGVDVWTQLDQKGEPGFQNVIFIDLDRNTHDCQISWHYPDNAKVLFAGIPESSKAWDGHNREEKFERIVREIRRVQTTLWRVNNLEDYEP